MFFPYEFSLNGLWALASKKGFSRYISWFLVSTCVVAGIGTYWAFSQENFLTSHRRLVILILNLDLILLLALGILIARRLVKLWSEHRAGRAGSRLHVTFVGLFGVLTLVPTVTVTLLSGVFFNQGIQSWFSDRVRTALQQSTEVAEAYLHEHQKVISASAEAMARDIAEQYTDFLNNPQAFHDALEAYIQVRGLDEALVFDTQQVLARSRFSFSLQFASLDHDVLQQAQHGIVMVPTRAGDRVRALVRIAPDIDAYLFVGKFIDPKVQARIIEVQQAVSEYKSLENQREDLELKFSLIFIVISLLLMLGAFWVGLIMASRMARPMISLIEGAEAVSAGKLSTQVLETDGTDEVALLVKAFNRMTRQLESQRQDLLEANRQLDLRRHMLEGVLASVKAGVIVVTPLNKISLTNKSAQEMLGLNTETELLSFLPEMAVIFEEAKNRDDGFFQTHMTLSRKGTVRTYLVHLAMVEEGDAIVTFDDISDLLSAQRNAAWRDVAQRIAHEIKNPLTPIQLSVDRIRRRYQKMIPEGDTVFQTCIDTIVRQVESIGRIVSEFSAFARMPSPKMALENLTIVAEQAVFMMQSACPDIKIKYSSPDVLIWMRCDVGQIQQVLTNLLQNASDAVHTKMQKETGFTPSIALNYYTDSEGLVIQVEDNGEGFPENQQDKLFEPYVTHKVKGTGLGLAIVKKIVEDHEGRIQLHNRFEGGASVIMKFPKSLLGSAPELVTSALEKQ